MAPTALPGQDGWLFLSGDGNDVIGQHEGRVRLSPDQVAAWEDVLRERAALAQRQGIHHAVFVAPDKEAVYREFLPPEVSPAATRPVFDVLRAAERAGARMRYLLPDLEQGKNWGLVYSMTDSHWTGWGAYLAYRAICAELDSRIALVRVLCEDDVSFRFTNYVGDLGNKLEPPLAGADVQACVAGQRSLLLSDNRIRNHGREIVLEQPGRGPTGVVFGESFGYHLLIYLKESFRRLVFVHTSTLPQAVLERERPDVLLTVPVERFLLRVPVDRDGDRSLAALVQEKRLRGEITHGQDRFLRGIPRQAA